MSRILEIKKKAFMVIKNAFMAARSLFWKKDDSVVIIGAWMGERFADNPRFLYQFLSENKKDLGLTHVVWVTHSEEIIRNLHKMGYEAVKLGSPESIKYHKLAKYHLCNNTPSGTKGNKNEIDAYYSFRAKRINLWHGVGIKRGVFCSNEYLERKKKHPLLCGLKEKLQNIKVYRLLFKEPGGWGDGYWLTTTRIFTEQFRKWFLGPEDHYISLDYPRNHECLKYTEEELNIISLIRKYKKTILYLPTYRNDSTQFSFSLLSMKLEEELAKQDILFIQKSHSVSHIGGNRDGNVLTLNSEFDINTIIPYISAVITDYSSVSMDAIFHMKPVIYYIPDWDEYLSYDRGLIDNPEQGMAGPLVKTPEEVIECILNLPVPDEHYYEVRNRYWNTGMTYKDIWEGIKTAVGS